MRAVSALLLAAGLAAAPVRAQHGGHDPAGHAAHNPAAPADSTDVPGTRSAADRAALLAGRGMGFGRAAEANGYPGPRHVLELADALALTPAQRAAAAAAFAAMEAEAQRLGAEVVAADRDLAALFARGTATPERVRAASARLAALEGELRATHLAAHLTMRDALTPEQVARYVHLRAERSAPPP